MRGGAQNARFGAPWRRIDRRRRSSGRSPAGYDVNFAAFAGRLEGDPDGAADALDRDRDAAPDAAARAEAGVPQPMHFVRDS